MLHFSRETMVNLTGPYPDRAEELLTLATRECKLGIKEVETKEKDG